MPTAIEKIQSLREQMKKEVEGVKTELAKQLAKAVETHKMLTELGEVNILADPQYIEYVEVLALKPTVKTDGRKTRTLSQPPVTSAISQLVKEAATGITPADVINKLKGQYSQEKIEQGIDKRSKGSRPWFTVKAGKLHPIK